LLQIVFGKGANALAMGALGSSPGVNLNPLVERLDDPDVLFRRFDPTELDVSVWTGAGADVVNALGQSPFTGPLSNRRLTLRGQEGPDRLIASPQSRTVMLDGDAGPDYLVSGMHGGTLVGSGGGDVLIGRAGPDEIRPGRGSDEVRANGAADWVFAYDGTGDEIDCGGGEDAAQADPFDEVVGCEVVIRRIG
jgi:Ca2+-binding RTX toxin-like protein